MDSLVERIAKAVERIAVSSEKQAEDSAAMRAQLSELHAIGMKMAAEAQTEMDERAKRRAELDKLDARIRGDEPLSLAEVPVAPVTTEPPPG